MKRIIGMVLILLLVFTGCTNNDNANGNANGNNNTSVNNNVEEPISSEEESLPAGIKYSEDQVYNSIYSGEIATLNYLVSSSTTELGLAANFVDTLIDYNNYGVMIPGVSTEWYSNENGLVWTFEIRKGINWYTSDGDEYAELTAYDFVDALKYTFNPDNGSKTANIAYKVLKNGQEYYDGTITDFKEVGVKAIDKYTLEYTLKEAVPYFESMLSYASFFPVNGEFLTEVGDRFGTSNDTILYSGAYILEKFEPQNKRVLVKNENYWDADKVYIVELNYKYNKEADTIGPELFLRGDVSYVEIPSTIIDAWMEDDEKKEMVRPAVASYYTYFYALNFDPNFDDAYGPDEWKIAVNNLNFRKSLFHGFDRIAALTTGEPYNPENKLGNTITPVNFVNEGGLDYTQMGSLKEFANTDSYNPDLALEYKEKAIAELEAEGLEFPVSIVIPYSTGSSENANRAQVVQQQLIRLLGEEYIEVFIVPYPASGFISNTRRNGNYGFELVNWGPDYADPETYTEPFATLYPESDERGGTSRYKYNFPESTTQVDENGVNMFEVYIGLIDAAKSETVDLMKRYELFAEAEAFIIDQAWVIPYRLGGGGYVASKLNPFESQYSPFGVAALRYKGQHILEEPMSTEQYFEEEAKWNATREEIFSNLK